MGSGSRRVAVVVPGLQFGPHVPLLSYAARAAALRGARIVPMTWQPPTGQSTSDLGPWVTGEVDRVMDRLAVVDELSPVLIGKSLGAHAAGVAADRGVPAVWLTPLLRQDFLLQALSRATAPCLLVGGTADAAWDGGNARSLSGHVVEIPDADHLMFVPGPLTASAAVLGTVATAVETFLDQVVWPPKE